MRIAYASQPLQLSPDRYEMLSLGRETLAASAKATAQALWDFLRQSAGITA